MKRSCILVLLVVLIIGGLLSAFLRQHLRTGADVSATGEACRKLTELVSNNSLLNSEGNQTVVLMRVRHGWTELCVENVLANDVPTIVDIALKSKSIITTQRLHIVFFHKGKTAKAEFANIWIE